MFRKLPRKILTQDYESISDTLENDGIVVFEDLPDNFSKFKQQQFRSKVFGEMKALKVYIIFVQEYISIFYRNRNFGFLHFLAHRCQIFFLNGTWIRRNYHHFVKLSFLSFEKKTRFEVRLALKWYNFVATRLSSNDENLIFCHFKNRSLLLLDTSFILRFWAN